MASHCTKITICKDGSRTEESFPQKYGVRVKGDSICINHVDNFSHFKRRNNKFRIPRGEMISSEYLHTVIYDDKNSAFQKYTIINMLNKSLTFITFNDRCNITTIIH